MIAADADDPVERLLPEPVVEAVDVAGVTGKAVTAVATMDEHVAAQRAEFLVQAVGIADDDKFHGWRAGIVAAWPSHEAVFSLRLAMTPSRPSVFTASRMTGRSPGRSRDRQQASAACDLRKLLPSLLEQFAYEILHR